MQSSWVSQLGGSFGQSSALAFVRVFKCEVVLAAGLISITLRNCQGLVRVQVLSVFK